MVEAGNIMIAPMTILHTGLWVTKRVPAWHKRGTRKQIPVAAKAQVHLQACVLSLTQSTFQITRPTLLFLLMYGVDNTSGSDRANLVEIVLDDFRMKKWMKVRDGYIHITYPKLGVN